MKISSLCDQSQLQSNIILSSKRPISSTISSMWANTSLPNSPTTAPPQHPFSSPTFTKTKYKGRRFAQIVKLKPECYEKYKECNANVWPDVLKQIRQSNIEDCEYLLCNSTLGCWNYASLCGTKEIVALLRKHRGLGFVKVLG